MNEVFDRKKTSSLTKEQIDIGKKYTKMLVSDFDLASMNAKTLLDTSIYFQKNLKYL